MGATLTIKGHLAQRLETLAKTTHTSKSSLATQALEEFL
ncbi:MAG: CopG family transcriptional regulator, partial [Nitrospirae bacterium CG22_combo_CG10-13_8_21_14_all_44_11]